MHDLVDIARQGGPTVIVVGAFLYYLIKRDKASRDVAESCHAAHERSTQLAADAVKDSTDAIRECKNTIGANTEVVREATKVLRRMNGNPRIGP